MLSASFTAWTKHPLSSKSYRLGQSQGFWGHRDLMNCSSGFPLIHSRLCIGEPLSDSVFAFVFVFIVTGNNISQIFLESV